MEGTEDAGTKQPCGRPPRSAVTALRRVVHHRSNPGTQGEAGSLSRLAQCHRSAAACTAPRRGGMIKLLQWEQQVMSHSSQNAAVSEERHCQTTELAGEGSSLQFSVKYTHTHTHTQEKKPHWQWHCKGKWKWQAAVALCCFSWQMHSSSIHTRSTITSAFLNNKPAALQQSNQQRGAESRQNEAFLLGAAWELFGLFVLLGFSYLYPKWP